MDSIELHGVSEVRREARRPTPSRRASHSSDSPFVVRGTDADGGGRTLMASGRRFLRPVRIPIPPHPHERAAGRERKRAARRLTRPAAGGCRFDRERACKSAPLDRQSEHHDLGRAVRLLLGGVPRPRRGCGCISSPSLLNGGQACQGSEPGREVGVRRASVHHRPFFEKRTARLERASPGGVPVLFRLSYVRVTREPPAGVEPTPRPYKGRVLAVDTTEAKMETAGVEPASSSLQARRSATRASSPRVRCGRVESNHHSAGTGLQPGELTCAQRPHEKGGRPDSNRRRGAHDPGCCRYTTATTKRGRPDSNRRPLA